MAPSSRMPNAALLGLLDQARWSRTQLAQAVNRVGSEAGLELRYDQSAVSHWLSGTMPGQRHGPSSAKHCRGDSTDLSRIRRRGWHRSREATTSVLR